MEAVLLRLESERNKDQDQADHTSLRLNAEEVQNVTTALSFLASALQEVVTLRQTTTPAAVGSSSSSTALATTTTNDADADDTASKEQEPDSSDSVVTASWLLNLCATVPSELEASYLARAIWEASRLSGSGSSEAQANGEAQQQAALFDALGMSEPAMAVLMAVTPVLNEIRTRLRLSDLTGMTATNTATGNGGAAGGGGSDGSFLAGATVVDLEEERRQLLLQDALDTAQMAAIAQAELAAATGSSNSGMTHTVTRTSDVQAQKYAAKAVKRAATALKRAREAGAIVDDADFLAVQQEMGGSGSGGGTGGLMQRSPEELWQLQQSLLPDGSRQYYDKRGLPHGTIWEVEDGIEKATIPAAERDESILSARLKIGDVLDPASAQAFAGTTSLNPMQSTVFDVAFNSRENVLVCAPTGAGKTNVAMLTVVAHFRDVGLIGDSRKESMETGKKVVYIAPMKALAQEIVEKFSSKLKGLGLIVRELTGDMQLSRAEADSAHVIVTTPEKWDVVTRKSGTDETSLGNQCGLLIIDEVHLLADERGAVIESVVARLHRLVESRQRQVRIVGLSATLPNYEDVALFLQVSDRGLFFFGPEYRPVPLQQVFIGVTVNSKDRFIREQKMNEICYDTVIDSLHRGYQVMVFVHSRKGTSDTARAMADIASEDGSLERFFNTQGKEGDSGEAHKKYADRVKKSRNREVGMHFQNGMGIHHAGMLRGDRKLTEQMFNDGAIRVLCCTATLAWGINLPAHTVVIKGTEVYNPEKGGVVDLSILDVKQIFGRAGRPQFDTSGEATLITSHDAFARYMDKLVRPVPIESNFIKQLPDHLNAEVVGGTVSNLREAATWLTYTYLYVRMLRNPLAYGINADQKNDDPMLRGRCLDLVTEAAKLLDLNKMVRFDANNSGNLSVADRGRVAANYYIQAESIASFNELLGRTPSPTDADLCRVICAATEFSNMKVRQEELDELTTMLRTTCPLKIKGAGTDDGGGRLITSSEDKAFVLMQTFISKGNIKSFTLMSDKNYIASNGGRVARSIFEICLKERKAGAALKLLRIAKSIDKQIWWFQTPLRHFDGELRESVFTSLENQKFGSGGGYDTLETTLSLLDMHPKEVGQLCKMGGGGDKIQRLVRMLPRLDVTCNVQPVTTNVLKFHISVVPDFHWHTRWHGGAQSFWLWVEDADNGRIFQYEHLHFSKRTHTQPITLDLSIPLFGSVPTQYFIRVISDSWVALEMLIPVPLWDIKMPQQTTPFTDLQDLTPLPITALQEPKYEQIYSKIESFNPIQTQLFHVLYHTDTPVLLGAPTGSGKTIVAELAVLRMKRLHPKGICVYIAPMKSLARERLKEWNRRLGSAPLNWKVLELSGDTHYDQGIVERADILVCTPEKWDLISRSWRGKKESTDESSGRDGKDFVKRVRLLVLDEVHLLGEERGAVLEAIVSRTRFISRFVQEEKMKRALDGDSKAEDADETTRIIGLSTALENASDLAEWIGIDTRSIGPQANKGLFNFRSSVRPVPCRVHVQAYSGKHYCPRMATMNKPCFAAIKEYSDDKPALIFVASRRQTRLTAIEIISYAAGDMDPKRFLKCSEDYIESMAETLHDESLRHTITFGIGLHHAGLSSHDRDIVEKLFLRGEILVLVATATLAWGVNLPARLVIVKGTEYFDGKSMRYVDYPLTDVLQMIGRAGRPGFDTKGEAVVMVVEEKKDFYKKFLYSPFPVESCLDQKMCENINAEISSGTISSGVEAVGYLTWTFFARRVKANPSYYGAESGSEEDVEALLAFVVKDTLEKLRESGCIEFEEDAEGVDFDVTPTVLGTASAKFYLGYRTPKQMQLGVREARKITMQAIEEGDNSIADSGVVNGSEKKISMSPFTRSTRVDEITIAWLLYTLTATHEFDELPVRHNEEILNEELSEELMWGPDTSALMAGNNEPQYHNQDIFADPHTKGFLLLQAYLERAKLPISDYVNDTKSVVDNIPRLLAAMRHVAAYDRATAGTFELLTQFSRTKQIFETRTLVDADPLLQLPGFTSDIVGRLQNGTKSKGKGIVSIRELRSMQRNQVSALLQQVSKGKGKKNLPLNRVLDTLYAFPIINVTEFSVRHEVEKVTGKSTGKLNIVIEIQREKPKSNNRTDSSVTLNLMLGSWQQRMLLADTSIRLTRFGKWTVKKELTFDWSTANADGGTDGGKAILRLLFDEIRGFDSEVSTQLN